MAYKKNSYHIALDGYGYMLKGTPTDPKRTMAKATVFQNRFAQGDRSYTDFSLWWFWAQTDWANGVKDSKAWADDAKFYYSTNIDSWSEPGSFKLPTIPALNATLTEDIYCGHNGYVNNTAQKYLGTNDNTTSHKPIVYQLITGTWTDISDAQITDNQNVISQISTRSNYLWVSTVGVGATNVVLHYSGSAWDDVSANISSVLTGTWQPGSSRCHVTIGTKIYIFVDNSVNNEWACVSATLAAPTANADFTKVIEYIGDDGIPISACEYNGNLYYLVNYSSNVDLRKYNIASSVDSLVHRFNSVNIQNWGMGDKLLHNYNGKLVITIPDKEIWEWDDTTLTRIYKRDDDKNSIGLEAVGYLYYGGVIKDNKIWWGNLMYDGSNFHNTIKDLADEATATCRPIFVDLTDVIWQIDSENTKKIYNLNSATFKSGADKNFMVFSEMEEISTVKKLAQSATIIFDPFDVAEEIKVYYSINGGSSYTLLGTASRTADGASITQKTFLFGTNITFSKIIFKIYLNGDGTSSPTFKDISLRYLPVPALLYQWSFYINANDNIKLLDGRTSEKLRGVDIRNNLRTSFLKQTIIDLEDVDYAETKINDAANITATATAITVDSTDNFPEAGRLKIESEEILYTSKSATQFKGCTRGYRGTTAATHADNTAVSNKYTVLISDFSENNPILNTDKAEDYLIKINLMEV